MDLSLSEWFKLHNVKLKANIKYKRVNKCLCR